MAKFGAAYGVRTGIHVGVDVLINRMGQHPRQVHRVWPVRRRAVHRDHRHPGRQLRVEIAHTEQTSADLELPMWLVYLAVPCGSYLMCFRFLQVTFSFIRTGELPKHDHSHVEGMDDQPDDINWFAMDDNLHPHGVAHDKREGK